jgi:phage tail-like protein
MANPSHETVQAPFVAFNFAVEIDVDGIGRVCAGAFAECDGLELTFEPKTLREGGNNGAVIRLAGPAGYGTVTLKRGMTPNFDLWAWATATIERPALRGNGRVIVFAADGKTERARFDLERCLPVKVKAPPLNAAGGAVAIEELGLVFERLTLVPPAGGPRA